MNRQQLRDPYCHPVPATHPRSRSNSRSLSLRLSQFHQMSYSEQPQTPFRATFIFIRLAAKGERHLSCQSPPLAPKQTAARRTCSVHAQQLLKALSKAVCIQLTLQTRSNFEKRLKPWSFQDSGIPFAKFLFKLNSIIKSTISI